MVEVQGHVKLINSCSSTQKCVGDVGGNYYLLIIIYYLAKLTVLQVQIGHES